MYKPIFEAAISYAGRGWWIFPAHASGAKKSYKAAIHSGGRKWGLTRDLAEIEQDWKRWPNANVGVVTGSRSLIWVLDLDIKEGVDGRTTLEGLIAAHGFLPLTLMARSPSGSLHYYWQWPLAFPISNSTSKIGPGIDVRGEGGMVIAPPSERHGQRYRWLNDLPVAHAPAWLISLARKSSNKEPVVPTDVTLPNFIADKYNQGRGVSTKPEDNWAPPTPEEVREALGDIDPDCDYQTWMRVGAACKDHQDLFVEWSATGTKFPGERECRQRAAEFAMMTAISVATLFHIAGEYAEATFDDRVNLDDY